MLTDPLANWRLAVVKIRTASSSACKSMIEVVLFGSTALTSRSGAELFKCSVALPVPTPFIIAPHNSLTYELASKFITRVD